MWLHFPGFFSYIRKTLNRVFQSFPFMFFYDCGVSNKGNPGTLSHLKLITYWLVAYYTNVAFKAWTSKSNRNSCWKIFLKVVVPDKFCRNNNLPDKILTSTRKLGTFIIIPEVSLRIFPNFLSTEVAFGWCSTKVVVLQKDVMRCSYYALEK